MKISNLSEEKKTKLRRLLGIYIPQACFVIYTIEPALKVKPLLYNIVNAVADVVFIASIFIVPLLCENKKDFLSAIFDSRFNWLVWLFISLIGILVSYAFDSYDIYFWLVCAVGDLICILLPKEKILNNGSV